MALVSFLSKSNVWWARLQNDHPVHCTSVRLTSSSVGGFGRARHTPRAQFVILYPGWKRYPHRTYIPIVEDDAKCRRRDRVLNWNPARRFVRKHSFPTTVLPAIRYPGERCRLAYYYYDKSLIIIIFNSAGIRSSNDIRVRTNRRRVALLKLLRLLFFFFYIFVIREDAT